MSLCHDARLQGDRRRKQYTTKLKEWGYEKYIKEIDMRAIVRKDLKRKAGDPLRPSAFRFRGRPVPTQKIERYEKEKVFGMDNQPLYETTPSAISCETPKDTTENAIVQQEALDEVSNANRGPIVDIRKSIVYVRPWVVHYFRS